PSTTLSASNPYTLSLHDALPISDRFPPSAPAPIPHSDPNTKSPPAIPASATPHATRQCTPQIHWPRQKTPHWNPSPQRPTSTHLDRKSTRLNSSHVSTSYAVFCL